VIRKGKIKFSHCKPWKLIWGGKKYKHHSFLITVFEGYGFSPSGTAAFLQGK
jgi:hypothetical protein